MTNPITSELTSEPLEDLFERDPLSLTQEDTDRIAKNLVEIFRKQREVWLTEKSRAKETGTKVSGVRTKALQKQATLEKIKEHGAQINLDDIFS